MNGFYTSAASGLALPRITGSCSIRGRSSVKLEGEVNGCWSLKPGQQASCRVANLPIDANRFTSGFASSRICQSTRQLERGLSGFVDSVRHVTVDQVESLVVATIPNLGSLPLTILMEDRGICRGWRRVLLMLHQRYYHFDCRSTAGLVAGAPVVFSPEGVVGRGHMRTWYTRMEDNAGTGVSACDNSAEQALQDDVHHFGA